jgi:iron complex outermembrane receptor protein
MISMSRMAYLCATAAILAFPAHAIAQSAGSQESPADDQNVGLEDIIVTATRSETSLQDTPIAITAFSSKSLEEKSMRSLQDVATSTPNLSLVGRAGTGGAGGSIAIRGIGVDAVDSSAAVGTYIDEVYFGSTRGNILGLLDVNRIEVLRGPQGTLFGRNTIAGAIQYVTMDPSTQEIGGYLSGALGNFKRKDIEAAINVPLSDTLAIRVAGKYNDRDGYVYDRFAKINRGGDESVGARIKLRWMPTERLTIDLKGEYVDTKTNGHATLVDLINPNAQFAAVAAAFGETRPFDNRYLSPNFKPGDYESAGYNADDYFKFDAYTAQGIIRFELTDELSLKSITAKAWYHNALAWDGDLTPLSILSVLPANDRTQVFTQELQLQGRLLDNRLHFTLGGYYFNSDQKQNPGTAVVIGLTPPQLPYGNPRLQQESFAGYVHSTFDLTDALTATLGVRYSHEVIKGSLMGTTSPDKVTFNDWSPNIGLDFKVAPHIMLYAKASKGFRAGGFTPSLALIGAQYPSGNRPFGPETAWTYEAGARLEFLDRRLRINPTVFLTDWTNSQFNSIDVVGNTPVPVTKNAGDARIKGFELESQLLVTDQLTLSGSLALLESHYTRVDPILHTIFPTGWTILPTPPFAVPNSVVLVPDLTLNNELQQSPKAKFTLGARYELPLANDGKIVANLDYSWTARQVANVMLTASVNLPSYGLLNGRLTYTAPNDRFKVSAYGRNLTNEYYLIGGTDFANGYTAGSRELDPGLPREFGVEVRFNF